MRTFVDTNVLAYLLDDDEPAKQERARQVLVGATTELRISTQVLIELHAVLTRKLGVSRADAARVLEALAYPAEAPDRDLVLAAARTAQEHQLSIFDALIVEAAASAGCEEVWSEDLSDGQTIHGVRAVNPFRDGPGPSHGG